MKVTIIKDEWYPVYSVLTEGSTWEPVRDVPEETVARWKRVDAEFSQVQEEMRKTVEGE